jgi:ABC-type branched-subunit amino acid transport system substrate-binding protein
VQAIVGGLCSAETMAGGQIAQSAGVVLLSPTSSATEIATIGAYVFKFYSDDSATKELSKYIIHQTPNNIVIVAENSDACVGFAKDLSAYFPDKASTTTYQTTEKDFVMLAKQLRNKLTPEDFLVMLPCNDVNLETIIKAFEREGILEMMKGRIAGNEMLTSASAYERLGNLLNGMKTAGLKELAYFSASGKALAEEFVSQKLVTSNQVWGVLEAEAMALIIEAIEKVGNNAEAIKDYLTAFNADNLKSGYFGDYYFTPERNAE